MDGKTGTDPPLEMRGHIGRLYSAKKLRWLLKRDQMKKNVCSTKQVGTGNEIAL